MELFAPREHPCVGFAKPRRGVSVGREGDWVSTAVTEDEQYDTSVMLDPDEVVVIDGDIRRRGAPTKAR